MGNNDYMTEPRNEGYIQIRPRNLRISDNGFSFARGSKLMYTIEKAWEIQLMERDIQEGNDDDYGEPCIYGRSAELDRME